MKTLTMNDERILGMGEKMGKGKQDILRAKSSSWWNHLLGDVNASFAAPFRSDWDKNCGLHWREWGKL
jgi:hypothetical protein